MKTSLVGIYWPFSKLVINYVKMIKEDQINWGKVEVSPSPEITEVIKETNYDKRIFEYKGIKRWGVEVDKL